MIKSNQIKIFLAALVLFAFVADSGFAIRDHSQKTKKAPSKSAAAKTPKSKLKPFGSVIKDHVKIEGLFTFYRDTVTNTVLMAVKPDQLGVVYLAGESVSHGDGAFVEGSRMFGTSPIYFKRVANNLMVMEKNLRIRADSSLPIAKAVNSGISDALVATLAIKSGPEKDSKAFLVDPKSLFLRDALNINYFLGQMARTGIKHDAKNSYFGDIASFPGNSEIDVVLHFKTSRPQSANALQNPYSFFHTFHYSIAELPSTDYVPRLADDRVGNFMTLYQDYSELDRQSPYVRYINRWNLKKKNPGARISQPVEPIVFWIENTTPVEYRKAIAEGIEFWNQSFEKIGFKNAIVAKIMPDSAEWDPADARYSTVRWLVAKNYPYVAIGTSRANPYTGQIYDADIGFVSEAVRSLFSTIDRRIEPLSGTNGFEEYDPFNEIPDHDPHSIYSHTCQVGDAAYQAAFGMSYIQAMTGDFEGKSDVAKEYANSFIRFVIAHEVGHTLGFRHNFIASTIYSRMDINNPDFTNKYSSVGTVMEYPAANVAARDEVQGEYYPRVAGPYDDWVIEYSYSDFDSKSPFDEVEQLEAIASRSTEPGLLYATDEDTFGSSVKSIDPRTNVWDVGNDPIEFVGHEISMTRDIWFNLIKEFEKPGTRYQKIRNVFRTSFTPYFRAAMIVPKYVGGIYHSRHHIGQGNGELPFEVVPVEEQRRAIAFLRDNVFAADAFDLPPELVNKLQEENLPDFNWTHYTRSTVDFPLHQIVLSVQQAALSRLYSPFILGRLVNNLERVESGSQYTMLEMFRDVRQSIWGEITTSTNVNSFRRQLQLAHLDRMIRIYLSHPSAMPSDARTLAANDLEILNTAAKNAMNNGSIDNMTRSHYKEVIRQIDATLNAEKSYIGF